MYLLTAILSLALKESLMYVMEIYSLISAGCRTSRCVSTLGDSVPVWYSDSLAEVGLDMEVRRCSY